MRDTKTGWEERRTEQGSAGAWAIRPGGPSSIRVEAGGGLPQHGEVLDHILVAEDQETGRCGQQSCLPGDSQHRAACRGRGSGDQEEAGGQAGRVQGSELEGGMVGACPGDTGRQCGEGTGAWSTAGSSWSKRAVVTRVTVTAGTHASVLGQLPRSRPQQLSHGLVGRPSTAVTA